MNVIKVDEDKCSACKSCFKACWIDVIRWDEDNDKPVIAYPEDCVECGFCEVSCKEQALTVNPCFTKQWPDVYQSKYLITKQPVVGEAK
jgi:NAD-dependent dihydropyrimidine dehydrogenase PreA subunit